MLTREQYQALVARLAAGETLTRSDLEAMQAYQRHEAGQLSTRLSGPDGTQDDATRVDALDAEASTVGTALAAAPDPAADAQRMRDARARISDLVNGFPSAQQVTPDARQRGDSGDSRPAPETRTIAQRFVEHPQIRALADRDFVGQAAVDFPDVSIRTTIDSTGVGFNGSRNPYQNVIDTTPDRVLRLADLVDNQTTGLSSVPYLIEGANTGAAAEVGEGLAKPEAAYTFTESEQPVRTIAHWVPITRQAAEDNPTMMGYINGRLSYGLELRLDAQILAGNGTAPNLRGIINTSGVGTYTPGAAEARIITLRKAITVAQLSEYQPDTAVLHPTDWQGIELDTDNNNSFRVTPNVQGTISPRLWGLNVVVTTAITVATYLVGAMRLGATLWMRNGIRLLMTDSHASNFTANILVILAEFRAALTVWRPAAFVKGAFV